MPSLLLCLIGGAGRSCTRELRWLVGCLLPLVENGSGVRRLAAGFFVHSVHYHAVVGMFGGFCNRRWCVMRMSSGTAMSLTTHKPSGDSEQRRE